ncbi:hypothetical protein QUA00_16035 [Microcoleus sp. T2B6]|uniref:hypothetical protein n=1 Tax=Microcoleus sp. T2B6 TaxID=3055424 RepID=UPI002FCEB249
MPVPKQVIENGARCQLQLTSCTIVKNGQDARSTKNEFSCGTGILPVPRQVIENGARCELQRTLNKADRTRSLRHRFSQVNKFALGRSARYCKL